jgi:hypothetical protein
MAAAVTFKGGQANERSTAETSMKSVMDVANQNGEQSWLWRYAFHK